MQKRLQGWLALVLALVMLMPLVQAEETGTEGGEAEQIVIEAAAEISGKETSSEAVAQAQQEGEGAALPPYWTASRPLAVVMTAKLSEKNEPKAQAGEMLAKLLLARNVTDGLPVQVYSISDSEYKAMDTIFVESQWGQLMNELAQTTAKESKEPNANVLRDFLSSSKLNLNDENEKEKNDVKNQDMDLWVIHVNPKDENGVQGEGQNYEKFLADDSRNMYFVRIQKAGETSPDWLDEKIAAHPKLKDFTNFYGLPLYYDEVLVDAMPLARAVLGLNLEYALPDVDKAENGDLIWHHDGRATLLQLTPGESGIAVMPYRAGEALPPAEMQAPVEEAEEAAETPAPGVDQGADASNGTAAAGSTEDPGKDDEAADEAPEEDHTQVQHFPIMLPMTDTQTFVLLRNLAPGDYRITGAGQVDKVAYEMNDVTAVLQDVEDTAINWYLEDHALRLSVNLPQVRAEDVVLETVLNGEAGPADARLIGSDEAGHVWQVTVPRQELGTGTLVLRARVGDYAVETVEYTFTVVDRPLTCSGEAEALFTYYYKVPGQEETVYPVDMTPFFVNEDRQALTYTFVDSRFAVEGDTLLYTRGDNTAPVNLDIQVTDGVSAPVSFRVNIQHEDVVAAAEAWQCDGAEETYTGALGVDKVFSFVLPATAGELYEKVRAQYPALPENLADAMQVTASVNDSLHADDDLKIPYALARQQDGSILLTATLPAYTKKEDCASIGTLFFFQGQEMNQQLLPKMTLTVNNDMPILAEGIEKEVVLAGAIEGSPKARVPLTLQAANATLETPVLPAEFVPVDLFRDQVSLEGLTVTLRAEPALSAEGKPLVSLTAAADGSEVKAQEAGMWVIGPQTTENKQAYQWAVLDKGEYTFTLTATDGEFACPDEIVWKMKVSSPYDTTKLIILIAAAVIAVAVIVLLVLREINKPSFARMNSAASMSVCTNYSPKTPYVTTPMAVYGKKETDLAHLFIACQQAPMATLPLDVLADVELRPGKRRTFRLMLGKRAENLNVVVGDQAANVQKPIVFGQNQPVRIYADLTEILFMQIGQNRENM